MSAPTHRPRASSSSSSPRRAPCRSRRIGYQSPNARLAATVGAIAKACAPAGITVQDVATDDTGPLTLRDNKIDVLLASTGGAAGSGSTGSNAMDAYDLQSAN